MVVSHPCPPLLPPLLLLDRGPQPERKTQTRAIQVPSAPANDRSTVVRYTWPVRRQYCREHLRLFRKILGYLLPVHPVTQRQFPLFRAYGLLRHLLQSLIAQHRGGEPPLRARFPSARVQFRRREHALRAPFPSAMVQIRRRERAFPAPFPPSGA